jgi:hypothetical protein
MQEIDNLLDDLQFRLGDLKPPIESINEFLSDAFGGHRFNVFERAKHGMRLHRY